MKGCGDSFGRPASIANFGGKAKQRKRMHAIRMAQGFASTWLVEFHYVFGCWEGKYHFVPKKGEAVWK